MALKQTMATLVAFVSVQFLLVTLLPVAMAARDQMLLHCSMLPTEECAFAVDSKGHRCVLETLSGGIDWHVCQASDISVGEDSLVEYIETDQCVKACGVTKMTVGLSTDALESEDFTSKLCSLNCQENCLNLVDLYTNLAAGEGKSLRLMCAHHHHRSWDATVHRRKETEVYQPELGAELVVADEPSPSPSSSF